MSPWFQSRHSQPYYKPWATPGHNIAQGSVEAQPTWDPNRAALIADKEARSLAGVFRGECHVTGLSLERCLWTAHPTERLADLTPALASDTRPAPWPTWIRIHSPHPDMTTTRFTRSAIHSQSVRTTVHPHVHVHVPSDPSTTTTTTHRQRNGRLAAFFDAAFSGYSGHPGHTGHTGNPSDRPAITKRAPVATHVQP